MDAALPIIIDPKGAKSGADAVNRELASIKRAARGTVDGMRDGFTHLKETLFSLKTAFVGLGVGLLANQFKDAADESEQVRVRLNVLLGDVQEGNRLFENMSTFASSVSFGFDEIMQSAAALAGVLKGGVDEVTDIMPLVADLSAAAGLTIEETTQQVIRMFSAGAASADLFRERGILAMLGFQAGVSYSAEETRKRLIAAWEDPASKFRDASKDLANTWTGLMSMFGDQWFQFRNAVMDEGPFDFMKANASILLDTLNENKESIDDYAKTLGDALVDGAESFALGTAVWIDRLNPLFGKLKEHLDDVYTNYSSLPQEVQELGILGILMFGKKGAVVIALAASQIDDWKRTAEWWNTYQDGEMSFFEWLFSGDQEDMKRKLAEIQEQAKLATGRIIRSPEDENKPGPLDALLPPPEEVEERGGEVYEAMKEHFKQVRELMEKQREERNRTSESTVTGVQVEADALGAAMYQTKEYQKAVKDGKRLYEQMKTPQEEYSDRLLEIQRHLFYGTIGEETANRARQKAFDTLNKELDKAKEKTSKLDGLAKDLGLTFSSAFEDAIFKGEEFRDVVKALGQDILKMIVRQTITAPMANMVGTAISGFFAGGFASGGSFTVPGTGGTDSQVVSMLATPGERVDVTRPGQQASSSGGIAVSVNNSYNVEVKDDSSSLDDRLMLVLQQASEHAYNKVFHDISSNGPIRRQLAQRS